MLYYLSNLTHIWGPFRLYRYVTFRAGCAAATAFLIVIILAPLTIKLLKKFNTTAPSRHKGLIPDEFLDKEKDKTPSMGGILIVFSIVISTILWSHPTNPLTHLFLLTVVGLGAIGFLDDYFKIAYRNRDGISGKVKIILQFLIAILAVLYLFVVPDKNMYMQHLYIPFMKYPILTGFYGSIVTFMLGVFVVVGSSNAVNLTDGKDGLATGSVIFCALAYAVFAYLSGNIVFSDYLNIFYIPGAGEIGIFAASIIGACIGFLWYNCHPASMFMGDTGSLALGGSIGLIAVLVREELILLVIGGVFVIEALSVILQVASFKLRGKRIFLCAPIHHHFERKGWTETQIVVRFWILSGIFALIGLASLKLH
ncbi:MAG TPA: phospho-N-acetylmuramoyl-pentapeptide-transferase [Victivallales bacterium]|nr:phospho-N-acetylmuramoyl-pentapeptide-transferase [Victivallales bacterium]